MAEHHVSRGTGSRTSEHRDRWQRRATWLTQLGLSTEDPPPVEVIEDIAGAVHLLLAEVKRLELERAEARAWAWADYHHRELHYDWVSVAGNTYTGDPDELTDWLADPRTPDAQEWWPAGDG